MSADQLSDLHLADLHARASAAGIERYRLLRREQLIERLRDAGVTEAPAASPRPAADVDLDRDTDEFEAVAPGAKDDGPADEQPRRRRRGRRGGRGRREREKLAPEGPAVTGDKLAEQGPLEEVSGELEVTRQRHGFLGVADGDDVYVSASQIRRCELKPGDVVTGPVRPPRRDERHPALVRVNLVNGEEPVEAPAGAERAAPTERAAPAKTRFDELTAVPPGRRIPLAEHADTLIRAADLLAPLAYGQRVLVRAAPHSGRTTLLRGLGQALAGAKGVELTVLLIDERPEEVGAWKRALPEADLALAPADLPPREQVRVATEALERARARAADGTDVVLACDSLPRLAVAADGVAEVKRLFGSGRQLEGEDGGSLTVIATTFADGDDDGLAERAVATTETALVTLDPSLAEERIAPALRFADCRAIGEENLLTEAEQEGLRRLRARLRELVPPEGAALLRELFTEHATNRGLLESLG